MDAKIRINGPMAFWGYDKTGRFAQSLLFCKLRWTCGLGRQRSEAPPDIRFWDATFRDYAARSPAFFYFASQKRGIAA